MFISEGEMKWEMLVMFSDTQEGHRVEAMFRVEVVQASGYLGS